MKVFVKDEISKLVYLIIAAIVAPSYTKEVCFRDITYDDVMKDRNLAKDWFKKAEEVFKLVKRNSSCLD